jgi:putative ABC transport system permease protein
MIENYFKIAWRNIVKSKGYSALNIFGLATGMAVALLIGLWVYYQFSYDRFLPAYQQAYKARLRYTANGAISVGPATPFPLADALKRDIPGIKYIAQSDWMGPHSLVTGEKKIYPGGVMASPDFIKIFRYPFLKGNRDAALQSTYSIVLTESTAKALFGNEDAMGKAVRIDNTQDLKVTGIIKDLPDNSTMKFNFIVPFSYYTRNDWVKNDIDNWRDNSFQTFVGLEPNTSYAQVESKIKIIAKQYNPEDYKLSKYEVMLQPIKDWHLYNEARNGVFDGGFIDYVKMFGITGILVLLIACINFMNLSTARSEKRAREVGIRKAIGSQRKDLIFQFLIESVVLSLIAGLISLLLVQLVLPAFNTLTKTIVTIPYTNIVFWMCMISYTTLTGLLAGSRPAFYLSSFNPVKVLKGTIKTGRSVTLSRKALVVLQFTCSIALIIGTIIVYQQIQHAKDRPFGFNTNRLLMTDASNDLNKNYTSLRNDLLQSGLVSSTTVSSSPVTDIWSNQRIDNWEGKQPNESLGLATIGVCNADYFKTMGMQIIEGNNFTGDYNADSLSVVLNEAAVNRLGYKQAINQIITWHDVPQRVHVIGIVKNAVMNSPFGLPEPTIFVFSPGWANIVTYRLAANLNTHTAIEKLTPIFNKYNPSYPYIYHFVDEMYESKFELETLIGKLAGIFAVLAIFISCLGLFGLAAYTAEQRTKEIGIRKVLGASVSQVWLLLSKDFIVLVAMSCVIASPIALYFLNDWLVKYPYRITITPLVFIAAGIAAIVITIATISFQAIKAALANPVKSLRTQ